MKSKTVTIIGLGLMGGSLGLALRKQKGVRVIGVSRTAANVRRALKQGAIHAGTTLLSDGVRDADIIVAAGPVSTIPNIAEAADRFARKGAVMTDVGSTKAQIIRAIRRRKLKRLTFIGSHPMAGSHETGLAFASKDLYRGANVFVVKEKGRSARALRIVTRLWQSVGARVILTDGERHDRIVSEVSQLPHLLAVELVRFLTPRFLAFVGPGFRDSTRIAQGDPKLWRDIVFTNRKNLLIDLARYRRSLDSLEQLIRRWDDKKVLSLLTNASATRRRLAVKR